MRPFFAINGASSPSDQYWGNVGLLLHMDGTPGSSDFTDVKGHAISAKGGAVIAGDIAKFGQSAKFAADGDMLLVKNSADIDISIGNFTAEAWLYPTDLSANRGVFYIGDPSSNYNRIQLDYKADGSLAFYIQGPDAGNSSAFTPPGDLTVNKWHHLATVLDGTSMRLYVNGNQVATATLTVQIPSGLDLQIGIARNGGAVRQCIGRIDDFRLTKGVARYSSNFVPPSRPFPSK